MPGAELRYATDGDGPDIVFLHGAGMDHTMFLPQAKALRRAGYRVILWDLRGHGASQMDLDARFTADDALRDIEALLEAVPLSRPVLIGHSLGGNLAQAFARRHPDRVAGIIVMDSTWNAGPLRRMERLGLRLAAPLLRAVPARKLPGLMARASAVTPEAIAETEAVFARMPKRRFIDVWRATASLIDPDPAYRTPVPLALMRGAEDRTGNIESATSAWARAENVAEHVIPDAGHIVTLDAPEPTSRALLDILAAWRPRLQQDPPRA